MKKLLLLIAAMAVVNVLSAQSVQYGYTEEYNGAKDKTPLTNVNINAGGATAKSGKGGKFKLEFKNLNVGDRVAVDVNNVAILKNYVLFNKEAIEQWTVSGKSVYFRIVLCKKKTFDNLVMTYYNVSDKSYKEQLKKERDKAAQMKRDGEIQQMEYERLLREAEERYDRVLAHLKENAELVARIDESELEGDQAEILRLAKEGKLNEAVELIKKGNTIELFAKVMKKTEYAAEQVTYYERKEEESRAEIKRLAVKMKNNIKILQLAGGKENLDLCGLYWEKIVMADTMDIDNLGECARFFSAEKDYRKAEYYYQMALRNLTDNGDKYYRHKRCLIIAKLASVHLWMNEYEVSEREYVEAMKIGDLTLDRFVDECSYLQMCSNYALLLSELHKYEKAVDVYGKAFEHCDKLYSYNPDTCDRIYFQLYLNYATMQADMNNFNLADSIFELGIDLSTRLMEKNYKDYAILKVNMLLNRARLHNKLFDGNMAENELLQALSICDSMRHTNPRVYLPVEGLAYSNMSGVQYQLRQFEKALAYARKAEVIHRNLAKDNPEVYRDLVADDLANIASVETKVGKYDSVEIRMKEALKINEDYLTRNPEKYNYSRCRYYEYIADYYLKVKDYTKAEETYRTYLSLIKSLAESNHGLYDRDVINAYKNLGEVFSLNMASVDSVCRYYDFAIQLAESCYSKNSEIYYGDILSMVYSGITSYLLKSRDFVRLQVYMQEKVTLDRELYEKDKSVTHRQSLRLSLYLLSIGEYELENYEASYNAMSELFATITLDKKEKPVFLEQLMKSQLMIGKFTDVENSANEILNLNPKSFNAKVGLCIALLCQNRIEEAKVLASEIKTMEFKGMPINDLLFGWIQKLESLNLIPADCKAGLEELGK